MTRRYFLAGVPALLGIGALASSSKPKAEIMKNTTKRMPALFISHGSPMNLILDNVYTRDLRKIAPILPRPKAILVVSAHWMSESFAVSGESDPETIHDFYGFPDDLYLMEYDAPGSPEYAARASGLTGARIDPTRGLDHGAWGVLHFLYPDEEIPVFQLSINMHSTYEKHYELGQKLASLRDEGIMIIGSGNATHNLRDIRRSPDAPVESWTQAFSETFHELVLNSPDKLVDPTHHLPAYANAHPTPDHYLPVLPVMGAKQEGESVTFFHQSIQHGTLDMSCFMVA